MANIEIARALKDKNYFNSLTEEQKAIVRRANPAGESNLSDSDLDTVSGGLGGGEEAEGSTTSTASACTCQPSTGPCFCTCG